MKTVGQTVPIVAGEQPIDPRRTFSKRFAIGEGDDLIITSVNDNAGMTNNNLRLIAAL